MRTIIDAVFSPVIDYLSKTYDLISERAVILSSGIDLSLYTGYFGLLGDNWGKLIAVTIFLCGLIALVIAWKAMMAIYLQLKESVKWW